MSKNIGLVASCKFTYWLLWQSLAKIYNKVYILGVPEIIPRKS